MVALHAASWLGEVVLVFLAATLAFDALHVLLHRLYRSRHPWARAVGGLHAVHHRFLDRNLRLHPELLRANLTHHVIPEYLTQVGTTGLLAALLPLRVVAGALLVETAVFLLILRARGIDINHRSYDRLPACRPQALFCLPHEHALHHVFPDAHFGSWLKLPDQILATAAHLRGRRVLLAGPGDALDRALCSELAATGATARLAPAPESVFREHWDVLVLHTAPAGGEMRYVPLIEQVLALRAGDLLPPEIWVIAPAARADPEFTRRSRGYFFDARVSWRHIALSPGTDASTAARRIRRRVMRGLHFVSTAPLPRALRAFLRFRFATAPVFVGPPAGILPGATRPDTAGGFAPAAHQVGS